MKPENKGNLIVGSFFTYMTIFHVLSLVALKYFVPKIPKSNENKDFFYTNTDFNLGCQKKVAMLDDYLYRPKTLSRHSFI